MTFDLKKENREYYLPGNRSQIVDVLRTNYVAVRSGGDPYEAGGAFQQAVAVMYAVSCSLRMCRRSGYRIEGFFDHVVLPLTCFWRQADGAEVDCSNKSTFHWIGMIRHSIRKHGRPAGAESVIPVTCGGK